MKKTFVIPVLGLAALFTACSGGSGDHPAPPPASTPREFVYALNDVTGNPNQIHGFELDPKSGALKALDGFPLATGGNGAGLMCTKTLTYDAGNNRLYVLNDGSDTVSVFRVDDSTGGLTMLPMSPITLPSGQWSCMAVSPMGSPLLVGDTAARLASYVVTPSSAVPVAGSPFATGDAGPYAAAFSRDGRYFYTGGNSGKYLGGYALDAKGGLNSLPGMPGDLNNAETKVAYATDGAGRLFMGDYSGSRIRACTTQSGVPTQVFECESGLKTPIDGLIHPSGYYMAADRVGNQVGVYKITGEGINTWLGPVSGSPFNAEGSSTSVLALSKTGEFLVVANGESKNLTVFGVEASTGYLTLRNTQLPKALGDSGRVTGLCVVSR